jgi:hypothetical protein
MEGPCYGRRYEIFYNQVKIGSLEIEANSGQDFDKWDRSVFAHIALDGVPITALPYHQVRSFLGTIASLVTSEKRKRHDGKTEYDDASSTIDHAMAETMWDVLHTYTLGEPFRGNELTVLLSGTPDDYYRMEAHEREERLRARGEPVPVSNPAGFWPPVRQTN